MKLVKILKVLMIFALTCPKTFGNPSPSCQIHISTDSNHPQPLYIRPGTDQFFYPTDRRGFIEMDLYEQMELFCVQFVRPAGYFGVIKIECLSGKLVRHNGIVYNFADISCRNIPLSVNVIRPNERCFNNSQVVDIGYQVENRFLKVFTSCHDPILEANHYTNYQLTPLSITSQTGLPTIAWRQHQFFSGKSVDNLYTIDTQRQNVAIILESQESADFFIRDIASQMFLARGHIAARTDFILGPEQRATFTFINAAPQYQSFNALNWEAVEFGTRQLAHDLNITLDTYTGTYGVTHFWNEKGDRREIFLGWPQKQIPVPMIYYRIIINQSNQSGIVFVGVNNIFLDLQDILRDYVLCTDIGDNVTYINWRKTDITRGYMYACDVNEFLKRVPHLNGLKGKSTEEISD